MHIKRRHFFWIVPFIILVIAYCQYLYMRADLSSQYVLSFTIEIQKDDQFKLFFVPEEKSAYTDENVIERRVFGMKGEQTIVFSIPESGKLSKLRLDIGQQPDQHHVTIKSVRFDTKRGSIVIPHEDLTPNKFISQVNEDKYFTVAVDEQYNPSIEFSESAITRINSGTAFNLVNTLAISLFVIFLLWYWGDLCAVNRLAPFYIIAGVCASVLLSKGMKKVMNNKMENEKVTVTVEARVKRDDTFTLFFQPSYMDSFTETHSISQKVIGSDDFQNIDFHFPDTVSIRKLRIDLGITPQQTPLEIKSIRIKRKETLLLSGEDIFSFFMLNDFVSRDKNSNILKTTTRQDSYTTYDPFIFSTDISAYMHDLRSLHMASSLLPLLVSFLFVFALVYHFVFNTSSGSFSPGTSVEYGFSIFFILVLLLPLTDQLVKFKVNQESSEKRTLSEKPEFNIRQIETYPRAFEAYYNDNFGFRNLLIRAGGNFKTTLFKVSPLPEKAIIGKQNWIYLYGESFGISQDIARKNLLAQPVLTTVINGWLERRALLKTKNIRYYQAIWPDKHNIYPEYLPFSVKMQMKDTLSKVDQMITALKEADSTVEIIDVRSDLIAAKSITQAYLKNDTHWNEYGAFVAYQKLIGRVAADYPTLHPKEVKDFDITWQDSGSGDLLQIMGMNSTNVFIDRVPGFKPLTFTPDIVALPTDSYPASTEFFKNNKSENMLRVLVFRDSYTRALTNLINPHFLEVLYIWGNYDQQIVDRYQPNIVIDAHVERYFE
jgi:hypothetical protein